MAVTSGFFDAHDHDRLYNAEDVGSLLDGVIDDGILNITDGITNAYGAHFEVRLISGLQVNVASGRGWFKRTWIMNDDNLTLTAEPNTTSTRRIDTVVIDVNKTDDVRANSIQIVKGSGNYQPTLIDDAAHKQYPLADLYIEASAITQVVDRRRETYASCSTVINEYYPVGTIYMSVVNTNPRELFGGTWEQISGRFLIGCGGDSGIGNGETGGSWTHTIGTNNLPTHRHQVNLTTGSGLADVKFIQFKNGEIANSVMGWANGTDTYIEGWDNHLPPSWNFPFGWGGVQTLTDPPLAASIYITTETSLTQTGHAHDVQGYTSEVGNSDPMTIKPPYLGVYIWKRVS